MDKTFTKRLFLFAIFTLLAFTGVFAQTITVGTVDPGPYGQGSSIAVPINVNTSGGCVNSGNTYNVYLSDASGNFSPGTLIGSYTGIYATFVNGTIPNGTPAGAGYKVEVKSTNPAVTSTVSPAFTISGSAGVTASLTTSETVSAGVFGRCVGSTSAYSFTTSAGGTVTASFFNETTQSYEASNVSIPGNFTPATTNYTVTGKSVDASGTVGTFDYQLVNNVVVNPFSPFGTPFVCMPAGGSGDLQFIMPITGPGGIINNYPGTNYTVNWGDGTSTTFTYCQIVALGGILIHTYTLPSCGQTSTGGATNSLTVVSHAISPYCGEVASAATTSAKVIITPITSFAAPSVACVGTALTIPNTSDPGPDYSTGAASTCAVNANAKYDWTLDGVAVVGYQGVLRSKSFIFPATTTHGIHTLTLHAETPAIGCVSPDYTQTICFEDPPQPIFSIPSEVCITGGPVTATNTSVVDATCGVDTYVWTVTGPGTVTYAGGTNAASAQPQFVFPVAGVYQVQLGVTSGGCGTITAPIQTIRVDAAPTASLSPNITICGNNLTFIFDPAQTVTKTTLTGAAQTQPTTYTWNITGGSFTFLNGTNANSQYPKILFADFATYTIQVTNVNACGTATDTQVITFVQSPTVDAGIDQNICASSPIAPLSGTITGSFTSYQWVGGAGAFSAGRNSLITNYTPTLTEINAGTVTLHLQANTALPAPCNIVTDDIVINITPTAIITSPPTASVCSGQALSYLITSNYPSATFTWTASVTGGAATGFTASGSGPNITDVLTNTGSVDATVSYVIQPTIGSCPGTPFTLNVSVHPLPSVTAVPVNSPNCNNQPADITLTSNVAGTSYTWTSTATAGMTGNTDQPTQLVTASIQDILVNSGLTAGTVTYVITPYNGSCPGAPVTTSITVQPTPGPSIPGPDQEVCATTTYTLQGNTPSPGTGKWTVVQGPAGATFSDDTSPTATISGLIPGNIYQFQWTITTSANCPTNANVVNITIDQSPVGGTTSSPANVCLGSNSGQVTLAGYFGSIVRWESSTDNGASWQPIANSTINQPYLNLVQTTQYRAVLHNGVCPDATSTPTTITVDPPPITSIPGPNDEVCNATTYTLQGNNPAPGTGKWTVASGPAGAAFSDDTSPTATVTGLIPGNIYQFKWTITGTASCPPNSNTVTITIDKAPVGGTTSSPATVCSGSNAGTITLAGQFGTIIRWELSLDNGASWQPIVNLSGSQPYSNLTQTTTYRAILQTTALCGEAPSTPTTITVNPVTPTSIPGPNDEVCSATTYNLHANSPAPGTGKWSVSSGPAGATFSDDTSPTATVSGLIPGSTYQFMWTITGAAPCPPNSNTVTIIDDKAPVGGIATANPSDVCSGSNGGQITLTGYFGTIVRWESSLDNGASWAPIANTSATLPFLNLTQTTTYRAWLHNSNTCTDVPSAPATVTVEPLPIASIPGPNQEVCNVTNYTLAGNNPAPGTGKWTLVSGPAGAIFSDDTNPTASVSGLIPGNAYQFKWTITGSPTCPPNSNIVTITIDKAPVGGTTSSPATVCAGGNNGQITLAGQFGNIVRWESSMDNGANWLSIVNTSTTQSYTNLTQTTQFRAILLTTGLCGEVPSTPTTITVNPVTPIADAGQDYNICNQTSITLKGNNPAPFIGVWAQTAGPVVNIVNPNSYQTLVTGLAKGNVYTFQWTIKGLPPCGDTQASITIGAYADVTASFTMNQTQGCGPTTVTFTNTSTPAPTGTFTWDFGDGSPVFNGVNPPTHSFPPSSDGTEITYKVTLIPTSNCDLQTPYIAYVKVSPQTPVAKMLPNQSSACGQFTLTAKNLSPGNNVKYDFYLKDAGGNIVEHLTHTDKSDAVFQSINPTAPTNYTVYVTATDQCGNQATSTPEIISVAPSTLVSQIQIKGGVPSVCLGSQVTFQNISTGGDRFIIKLYDENKNLIFTFPAGTGDLNYTPTATGVYYASITAGNTGCGDAPASALKQFTVYPDPNPGFTYVKDKDYNVTFNNATPDAGNIPASTLNYKWDFGDGTTDANYIPSTHHFDYTKSPFHVTLTATTPGTTCVASVTQVIDISFHGNLFLPNAFIPASGDNRLNKYYAKGFGMKKWRMQIFNNFGQLVWETTKLDDSGAPVEGWDGTYKGQIVQQGVYIWQITATMMNGEDWKGMSYNNGSPSHTGAIHLIR